MVRRAIARGVLAPGTNPGLLLEIAVGGVINHIATSSARLKGAMLAKMDAFAEGLVELVLRGVG